MATTWYLGPMGDLKALSCPETGFSTSVTRFGGVHQGLSGARTMDITGLKAAFEFEWTLETQTEWSWLNTLHLRHVPGPLRLINPMKVNRLSYRGASVQQGIDQNTGFQPTSGSVAYVLDYPTAAGYGSRTLRWQTWSAAATATIDAPKKIPVFPLEQYTTSLWMKAGSASTVGISMQRYDNAGALLSTSSVTSCSVTTSWTRFSITDTATAGCVGVVLKITPPSTYATPLYMTAAQLEAGASATTWELGGGAPEVVVDQLSTTSPRYPLTDCHLSLLEA